MEPINQRRNFLSKIGALGLSSLLPFSKKLTAIGLTGEIPQACTLIPVETRGPFPLFNQTQIASQTALMRSDVRETQAGVPFELTITVQNLDCVPVSGAQVYIWHCSKDGLYSGYSNNMNAGQAGLTYLRGIQTTDGAGQVRFTTIYPGWYNGRLTHIHAEVYAGNVLLRTSQFAFPLDSISGTATSLVNASYGHSNNSITSYNADNVFNDGYTQQLLNPAGSVSQGYTADHTFIVNYAIVPLKIISFTAGIENKNPVLWWLTENEISLGHFEIEQSTHPSKDFKPIGTINAANGSGVNNYSFHLPQPLPAAITYFRLKIINKDGTVSYSAVAALHEHALETLSLVNSFVTDELVIKHPAVYSNSLVKVVNMGGQLLATGKLKTGVSLTAINVNKLTDGAYLLIIESGIDRFVTKFYKGH